MVLAVPLFSDEVAPRFCAADELLVVEVNDDGAPSSRRLSLEGLLWWERLDQITSMGATVMLCCGFNKGFLAYAEQRGLLVIWGLAGRADAVVRAYLDGALEPFQLGRAGRCHRRFGSGQANSSQGHRRSRGPRRG